MSSLIKHRILLGLAVIMMLVPTIMFAAGPLRLPPLFEGDQVVEVACPTCEGSGSVDGEKCNKCSGQGLVPGIVAGPNRPVQIVGIVLSGQQMIEGARVKVDLGSGEKLSYQTNDKGQFGVKLPPGNYRIEVSHGEKTASTEVEVLHHKEPVAIEEGGNLYRQEIEFQL